MSKGLKDFIGENRRAFDDEIPAPDLWQRIDEKIKTKKKEIAFFRRPSFQWAAAAVIVVTVGITVYSLVFKKDDNRLSQAITDQNRSASSVQNDIVKMAPEYAATAKQISESIESRQKALKAMTSDSPELYDQFEEDILALDSSYRVLKHRAMQNPGREAVITAMLLNLQLQAELLGKQLQIIQDFKNNKTENNDTNSLRPI